MGLEKQDISFADGLADEYVELAKAAIARYAEAETVLAIPQELPDSMRQNRAAVFVSIKKRGQLRGCIGTIIPCCECVAEEVIQNAISACSRDPRFPPVRENEIHDLSVSVDVLTEPEPVLSADELDPSRYGVIVSSGYRRGLLLPDLAGVDSVEDQLMIALQKGGIRTHEAYQMERFEVIRHETCADRWPSVFDAVTG